MRGLWQYFRFLSRIHVMKQLDRRSTAKLAERQEKRFRRILRHASEHSPFYRRHLAGIDLKHCPMSELPPVTKAELMRHFDEVVTDPRVKKQDLEQFLANSANVGKPYLGKYAACHTSGSQGQPVLVVQPMEAMEYTFAAQAARAHNQPKSVWSAVKRLMKPTRWAIVLLRPGFFPSGSAFGYMPRAMHHLANIRRLNLTDPLQKIVEQLNEFQPQIITAYAHVLEQLGHEERAGRLRMRLGGKLEMLASMSEPLYPETRRFLQETFGVHVANHYAMGECMGLGIGCPRSTGAHLNIDLGLLEVCDESGRPVPDGQQGKKVYVTNLINTVMPFIRYEIDDMLSISAEPCPCGSPLPLINTIGGRNNDRIWIQTSEGLREIPNFFFVSALHEVTNLAEFQLIQTDRNRFELRAQPVPGSGLRVEDIQSSMRKTLATERMEGLLHIDVRLVASIPSDPRSGKHRRFVNRMPAPAPGMPEPVFPPSVVPAKANGLRLSA